MCTLGRWLKFINTTICSRDVSVNVIIKTGTGFSLVIQLLLLTVIEKGHWHGHGIINVFLFPVFLFPVFLFPVLIDSTLVALSRHSRGTIAALSWHSRGTLVALSWHYRGTLVALSWHCRGTLVALSRHSRGTIAALYDTSSESCRNVIATPI